MATSSAANSQPSHRPTHRVNLARHVRHAAKCGLCNHPSRAAIEFDFLNWRNPFDLVNSYGLRSLSTIYRHAHATGLLGRRRLNMRFALERIVERVGEVPVTASAVIRSIRAITRINDAGEWVDPPSRVIISREDAVEPQRTSAHKSSRHKSSPHNSRRANQQPQPPASTIFESALLEEISPEELEHAEQHPDVVAQRAAEKLSKAAKAPVPPEITIELSPELAAIRAARRRALEAQYPHLARPDFRTDSAAPTLAAAQTTQSLIGNQTHSPAEPKG